jgi:sugar phosphate isomerase/epimerase
MSVTRRQLLAGLAAGSAAAQVRPGNGPKARTSPAICLYSQVLIKVPYPELGEILRAMGVDGCDLTVMKGGHVDPEQSAVDLMRAIEAITGFGLDVPVLSTSYTNLADQTIRNVVAIGGEMGVPVFRAGHWKYPPSGDLELRMAEVQRDMAGLAAIARAVNMSVAIQNIAGDNVGAAIWDTNALIRGLDPRTIGYDFDIGYAVEQGGAGGWSTALRLALPRLKMVTARDFVWKKDDGVWKAAPCPLGEGMVDWPKFFAALARVRFAGPISLPLDYHPDNDIAAVGRDVAFLRKQIAAAYA